MIIQTSRFGGVEVDENRLLHFPKGLLGFPSDRDFALIQTGERSGFYWLQAVERPDLAFVVCDPRLFVTDFEVNLKAEDLAAIGATDGDNVQVFIIVNKVDDLLTGNLQGSLVVSVATRTAKQMVLSEKRYTTRHPLMRLPARSQAVSKTA